MHWNFARKICALHSLSGVDRMVYRLKCLTLFRSRFALFPVFLLN